MRSRKAPVNHANVNAEWEGSLTAGLEASDEDKPPSDTGPKIGTPSPRRGSDDDTVSARNAS
jgi:PiT family inorganic phosphate transporter